VPAAGCVARYQRILVGVAIAEKRKSQAWTAISTLLSTGCASVPRGPVVGVCPDLLPTPTEQAIDAP